jgi:hypothetical protein
VQQANYAREVFGAQQTRRWVLCFTLCQPEFWVWQLDRAGACGSTVLDINRNRKKFLATMLPFLMMDATQIGFDRRSAVKWMKASKLSTRRCCRFSVPDRLSIYRIHSPNPARNARLNWNCAQGCSLGAVPCNSRRRLLARHFLGPCCQRPVSGGRKRPRGRHLVSMPMPARSDRSSPVCLAWGP